MREQKPENVTLKNFSSFENFFKENYHSACLVALRYLENEQEAEDTVQETFLYLWEKRAQLQIQQSLKQYLFQSVKNRSINYLNRERKLHKQLNNEIEQIQNTDSEPNFSSEELAVEISKSIKSLPPQCKKIFLLAYIDNLSYAQIAESLNLSKNTIKTQMGIAYKILRQRLKTKFFMLFLIFKQNK